MLSQLYEIFVPKLQKLKGVANAAARNSFPSSLPFVEIAEKLALKREFGYIWKTSDIFSATAIFILKFFSNI